MKVLKSNKIPSLFLKNVMFKSILKVVAKWKIVWNESPNSAVVKVARWGHI